MNNCPFCDVSLIGELISDEYRQHYKDTHYRREIGIVDPELDEVTEYECPDCHNRWKRKDESLPHLAGLAEASAILGLHKNTIKTYMARGKFPEPIQQIASGPIWTRKQIEEWKKQ